MLLGRLVVRALVVAGPSVGHTGGLERVVRLDRLQRGVGRSKVRDVETFGGPGGRDLGTGLGRSQEQAQVRFVELADPTDSVDPVVLGAARRGNLGGGAAVRR